MNSEFLQNTFSSAWGIFWVIFFFGGSIFVHELGHFLAARARGLRVERFSIGFGPKLFGWMRGGVEYRLSLLPFGGYVLLPQLAGQAALEGDSSVDARDLPPISYLSRVIVLVAGAFFNVVFAFVLATILWVVGLPQSEDQATTRIGHVLAEFTQPDGSRTPSPAAAAGLRPGDVIRAIDGRVVEDWFDLQQTMAASVGREQDGRPRVVLTLERAGAGMEVVVNPQRSGPGNLRRIGIVAAETIRVGALDPAAGPGSPLQPGDVIVAAEGERLFSTFRLLEVFEKAAGAPVRLEVERAGVVSTVAFTPPLRPENAQRAVEVLGFEPARVRTLKHEPPHEQVADVVRATWRVLYGLLHPASDIGVNQMSGPPGIARVFYETAQADLRVVVWFAVLVNVNLAVLNLLPIPVLDGGHLLFATLGRLRGRELPHQLVGWLQGAFAVALIGLMLYVSFRDVRTWVNDAREDEVPAQRR